MKYNFLPEGRQIEALKIGISLKRIISRVHVLHHHEINVFAL